MIAVFLAGTGLILLLYGYRYSKIWARFLTVRVLFSQPHIYAGQTGELTEEIENRKKHPVPVVEIGFRVPKGIRFEGTENIQESDYVYKRDLFAIRGMERIVRRYRLTAHRRGYYTATQLSCHAPSFLFREDYILDRRVQEDVPGLYVYAPWVECGELLRAVEVILGSRESARRVLEDPFAFASIRDYTPEDPMKTINWKASARSGALKVNTYTSVQSEQVIVYLDPSDTKIRKEPELVEECISVAAGICRALLSKGLECTLVIGDDVLGPGRGSAFGCGIERSLTGDFSDVPFRLPALRPEAELSGDKIPVWITKNARQEDIRKLSAALEGRPALVVSVESGDVPGPVSEGNIRVLRREV